MKTIASLAVVALLSLDARAEPINLASLDDAPDRLGVTTGVEYGFVAGIGYSRIVTLLDRRIVIGGDVTLPWAHLDVSDYRVRASALVSLVGTEHWKLAGSLAPSVRGTHNDINTLTGLGLDISAVGGYYARHWFVAGEIGFDASLTTHVTNSDTYRMTVDATAVDGWYSDAGGNLQAGIQGGVAWSRYDLLVRLGRLVDTSGAAPMLPIYGTVTVAARF